MEGARNLTVYIGEKEIVDALIQNANISNDKVDKLLGISKQVSMKWPKMKSILSGGKNPDDQLEVIINGAPHSINVSERV